MLFPAEMKYSKDHEWMKEEDGVVVIGISDFAQDALGDVVFVNLPGEGDDVTAGEAFGDVESVKAVSDLVSPVSGTVCAVNEDLLDEPEQLNKAPYDAWLIKVENVSDTEELLDAAAYEAFCAQGSKSTSPHSLPSTRFMPTSTTTAPSFTISAVTNFGFPTAEIKISASRQISLSPRVLLWQTVTVASALRRRSAIGFPTVLLLSLIHI